MNLLFLDDVRPSPIGWHCVRDFAGFVRFLDERGCPDVVSFDHDLAPEHYEAYAEGKDDYGEFKTGYDCAKVMIERGMIPRRVYVHSFNAPGAERIANLFAYKTVVVRAPFGTELYNKLAAYRHSPEKPQP